METEWVREMKGVFVKGNLRAVARAGGWGMEWNPNTIRPWAAIVDGELLVSKNGTIRTFASLGAAKKAAEDAAYD